MALDKLGVYNDALLQIGERRLADLTESREPRFLLDDAWDYGALDRCLEIAKPVFARNTVTLNTPTLATEHALTQVHDLPADCVAIMNVYSDAKLSQEVKRYINEDRQISCEFDTIYLRYVSNTDAETFSKWSPIFAKLVSSYLASELTLRITPEDYPAKMEVFQLISEQAFTAESQKEPQLRSGVGTTTLTPTLLAIYNDALYMMGLDKIVNINDDSQRRSVLDTSFNSNLVSFLFEDIAWTWATTEKKIEQNPSVEPEWGFQYALDKPEDMIRFDGIWYDEYQRNPIKHWFQDSNYFFCDVTEVYIRYVSDEMLTAYDAWSPTFRKLVAGRLAQEVVMVLAPEMYERVEREFEKRWSRAKSVDAQQSSPFILAEGSWIKSRYQSRSQRRRP